jgi:hypothetical protein
MSGYRPTAVIVLVRPLSPRLGKRRERQGAQDFFLLRQACHVGFAPSIFVCLIDTTPELLFYFGHYIYNFNFVAEFDNIFAKTT